MLTFFLFGGLAYIACVVLFSVMWMRWQNRMVRMDSDTAKACEINSPAIHEDEGYA
jgi:hypothetical protein